MSEEKTEVQPPIAEYPAVTGMLESIPEVVKESKPGIRTTEFWLTIAISLLTVLNGIPLPDKYEGFVVAALGAAYAISRGIAKKGIPAVEANPAAVAPVDEIVQRETGDKIV